MYSISICIAHLYLAVKNYHMPLWLQVSTNVKSMRSAPERWLSDIEPQTYFAVSENGVYIYIYTLMVNLYIDIYIYYIYIIYNINVYRQVIQVWPFESWKCEPQTSHSCRTKTRWSHGHVTIAPFLSLCCFEHDASVLLCTQAANSCRACHRSESSTTMEMFELMQLVTYEYHI